MRINKGTLYATLILFLIFSEILQYHGFGFLTYLDEIIEVFALLILFIKQSSIEREDKKNLLILGAFLATGILGNVIYKYQSNVMPIVLDIVATIKGVLFYYAIKYAGFSENYRKNIVFGVAKILRPLCALMFLMAIVNLFFDIGMSTETRFGLKGFTFIAPKEGIFSLTFYPIIAAFMCEAVYKQGLTRKVKIGLALALLVWSSTLRSRAIAFSILFIVLALRFMLNKKSKKINIVEIVGVLITAFFLGKDQIDFYFGNTQTARYALLAYGIENVRRFFPIGSGFATYGSEMAARFYSPLYLEYGFSHIWGLASDNLKFANDSFWGEILGQFGLIGTSLLFIVFYKLFHNMQNTKLDNVGKLFFTYICMILIIGTSGTKTLFHPTIVPTFMFMALAELHYKEKNRFILRAKYRQ